MSVVTIHDPRGDSRDQGSRTILMVVAGRSASSASCGQSGVSSDAV